MASSDVTTLGKIIGPEAGRDAIHIAVAPVRATQQMAPGTHIGLVPQSDPQAEYLAGPGGPADQCFYCDQVVGQPHRRECEIVHKRVKLVYKFVVEVKVPHSWTIEDVLYHRNDSIWCASNALADIEANSDDGCPCAIFKCEWAGVIDDTPTRDLRSEAQVASDAEFRRDIGIER